MDSVMRYKYNVLLIKFFDRFYRKFEQDFGVRTERIMT